MPVVTPPSTGSTSAPVTVPTQQVFDYLLDSQGNPIKGAVVCITLGVANAQSITPQTSLSSVLIRVTTDQNGYWTANLIPNANINPANTTYSVQVPGLDAYSVSIPSSGGAFQSTSPSVLVSTPGVLAPATTGITGNLTVAGNETVTGTLSVSGTTTLGSTTTGALTTAAATVGGDLTIASAFRLLFGAAVSKIVPGATSLSLRNHADNADNLIVTDAGAATVRSDLTLSAGRLLFSAATAKIVPGATSLSLRNNADGSDNVLVADSGDVTIRGALTTNSTSLHAEVYLNAAQSIPNGASTQVLFDTVESNPGGAWSTVNKNFVAALTGRYLVTAVVGYAAAVGNNSWISIFVNGAEARRSSQMGGNVIQQDISAVVRITSTNLPIDIRVTQSTGGAVNTQTGSAIVYAQFTYLGPL